MVVVGCVIVVIFAHLLFAKVLPKRSSPVKCILFGLYIYIYISMHSFVVYIFRVWEEKKKRIKLCAYLLIRSHAQIPPRAIRHFKKQIMEIVCECIPLENFCKEKKESKRIERRWWWWWRRGRQGRRWLERG